MKKLIALCFIISLATAKVSAQIDFNNLNLDKILGKVMNVKRGFAPKFSLGNVSIPKIAKVAEIIGLKKSEKPLNYSTHLKPAEQCIRLLLMQAVQLLHIVL